MSPNATAIEIHTQTLHQAAPQKWCLPVLVQSLCTDISSTDTLDNGCFFWSGYCVMTIMLTTVFVHVRPGLSQKWQTPFFIFSIKPDQVSPRALACPLALPCGVCGSQASCWAPLANSLLCPVVGLTCPRPKVHIIITTLSGIQFLNWC